MAESIQSQLTSLLERASTEHHEYEQSVLDGKRHDEWAEWYAAWLVEHGINGLLNSQMTGGELADLLETLNRDHENSDGRKSWAQYTSEQLIGVASGPPVTNDRG